MVFVRFGQFPFGTFAGVTATAVPTFGRFAMPEVDKIASGTALVRLGEVLAAAVGAGTVGAHSVLPLVNSPGIETNVVPVRTSNISTLVLSAHS
jgi:hypothetical protein